MTPAADQQSVAELHLYKAKTDTTKKRVLLEKNSRPQSSNISTRPMSGRNWEVRRTPNKKKASEHSGESPKNRQL